MNGPRRHLLLVNPSAGGGRTAELLPEVEQEFRRRDLEVRVVLTQSLDHGRNEALSAAGAGEIPVVMSGDGLIGQIGGALAGGEIPMGILPGGRGNDLARSLEIPREIPGAMDVIAAGEVREIDVGVVNDRRFLGIASCGFDSECNRIANETKLIKGNLVYLYSVPRALVQWKPARFTVIADGETTEFTGYMVAAANSKAYGGGMFVAPNAELDDGLLDVVYTSQVGKLRFLVSLPKVFKGAHLDNDEVHVIRAAEVEIRSDRPFAVYADGDHLADTPAKVSLLPRALRVISPPASST